MAATGAGRRRVCVALGAFVTLLLSGGAPALLADAEQDRRVDTGVRIFRAMLAADLELEKKTLEDHRLLVVFLYVEDRKRAEDLGHAFAKGNEPIRGLPVLVESTADGRLEAYARRVPAGIFLTQVPTADDLRALVQFGITHHVIVYSPFEGHVEKGVLGGLAVEAQVRPYVNQATLTASNIALKDFFLKVTKVYR